MNLGEQILSDLVAALKDLYPNIEVESTKNNVWNSSRKIRTVICYFLV